MTSKILLKYAQYNYWANDILFSLAEKELDEEMLDREIVSSFPSMKKTIYHIWDAEFIWLKRLKGQSLSDWPGKSFKGTYSEAVKNILLNNLEFVEYVNEAADDLLKLFSYKNIEGKIFSNPVWESIHHCMNHSTYHRGQVVTMLRQLEVTVIPSTDFITYCRSTMQIEK